MTGYGELADAVAAEIAAGAIGEGHERPALPSATGLGDLDPLLRAGTTERC